LLLWLPTLAYLPVLLDLGQPTCHVVVTPWSVLLLGGIGLSALAMLLVLFRLGTWSRITALVLLLLGGTAVAIGAWQHYHVDAVHLVEMRAGIDPMQVLTSYLGIPLVGAMFLAMGMFVSSLVRNQLLAALLAVAINLPFLAADFVRSSLDAGSFLYRLVSYFDVPYHLNHDFCRGQVDTRHLALYLSGALFFVFLTVRSLESRRWR
jgi:ABC-2 type transport system permease protein